MQRASGGRKSIAADPLVGRLGPYQIYTSWRSTSRLSGYTSRSVLPIRSTLTPRFRQSHRSLPIEHLALQAGESGLAQSTFGRAALLIHVTEDKATQLAYKLCQVGPPCITGVRVESVLICGMSWF